MDKMYDLVLMIVPALIVFAGMFFFLKLFFENETKRRMIEMKSNVRELVTPIQLQAYERMVLLLERISPYQLIVRVNKNGWSSRHFHVELIAAIRSEFEHNLSQQIYMTPAAWDQVVSAKEETIKIVNIASMKVAENSPSTELAQAIIEVTSSLKKTPTALAIEFVKREVAQKF